MSTPTEQLLQKMAGDKGFAETILRQSEIEKVIELAKDEGIVLTWEDIDEANAFIQKAIEQFTNREAKLTEEELENAAGGATIAFVITGGLLLVVSGGTAGAIAITNTVIAEIIHNNR